MFSYGGIQLNHRHSNSISPRSLWPGQEKKRDYRVASKHAGNSNSNWVEDLECRHAMRRQTNWHVTISIFERIELLVFFLNYSKTGIPSDPSCPGVVQFVQEMAKTPFHRNGPTGATSKQFGPTRCKESSKRTCSLVLLCSQYCLVPQPC